MRIAYIAAGLILLAVLLAGCAGTPKPADPIIVKQPVPVSCIKQKPVRPDFPDTDQAILSAPNIAERARLYSAGRLMRIGYIDVLEAAVAACE